MFFIKSNGVVPFFCIQYSAFEKFVKIPRIKPTVQTCVRLFYSQKRSAIDEWSEANLPKLNAARNTTDLCVFTRMSASVRSLTPVHPQPTHTPHGIVRLLSERCALGALTGLVLHGKSTFRQFSISFACKF